MAKRRRRPIDEEIQAWRLRRDKILLVIGALGLFGLAAASITVDIKDSSVALAALAVFGGVLGLPTVARLDEMRWEREKQRERLMKDE